MLFRSGGEAHALVFRDNGAAGEDGDILEHFLAAVAEAGSFDGADLEAAAETVDNETGEGVLIDIFSDDEEAAAALGCAFEDGKNILEVRDFLVVEKDEGVVVDALHLLGVGDEVGRDETAVELHAFYNLYVGLGAFGLLDRDDAFFLHFLHGLGDEAADGLVVVGRDTGHVFDFLEVVADFLAHFADTCHNLSHGFVDTAFEVHGVGTGGNVLEADCHDSLCEHGGGGCAVACVVAGL